MLLLPAIRGGPAVDPSIQAEIGASKPSTRDHPRVQNCEVYTLHAVTRYVDNCHLGVDSQCA